MIRLDFGMPETLQADELRHINIETMADDPAYLALHGCYKPDVRNELKGPSKEYWEKIRKLKEEIDKENKGGDDFDGDSNS